MFYVRAVLAAVAVAAASSVGAGCSAGGADTSMPAPSRSAGPPMSRPEVCAAAMKTLDDFMDKIQKNATDGTQAELEHNEGARKKAEAVFDGALRATASTLEDQARRSADPALKPPLQNVASDMRRGVTNRQWLYRNPAAANVTALRKTCRG